MSTLFAYRWINVQFILKLFANAQSCPLLKEYAISYFLLHNPLTELNEYMNAPRKQLLSFAGRESKGKHFET